MSAREIWTYWIRDPSGEWCEINVPQGAKVVHFAEEPSDGSLHFWAIVDHEQPSDNNFAVAVICTRHPVPEGGRHVATCTGEGGLVWHLFVREAGDE